MSDFETKVQELAQKALDMQGSDVNWLWRSIALLAFGATLWWTKYQVASAQRTAAAAQAAAEKIKAQQVWDAFIAHGTALDAAAEELLKQATANSDAAIASAAAAQAACATHKTNLDKISNWQDLNVLAGVKS